MSLCMEKFPEMPHFISHQSDRYSLLIVYITAKQCENALQYTEKYKKKSYLSSILVNVRIKMYVITNKSLKMRYCFFFKPVVQFLRLKQLNKTSKNVYKNTKTHMNSYCPLRDSNPRPLGSEPRSYRSPMELVHYQFLHCRGFNAPLHWFANYPIAGWSK